MSKTTLFRTGLLTVVLMGIILLNGCITQCIDLKSIKQAPSARAASTKSFKKSSYGFYMLFDLVPVKKARVEQIMKVANPQNKPVKNLRVTSQADILTVLLNLLNGSVIDRGVIFSLNKLTVEGDLVNKHSI